ncbi:MAG: hypothetical protein AB198_00840 [Parcubacteria bacterium C7867-003]|nr:MAG: hypothetical protein AB198_00840 [Parcubacteria bacterium C7867-003]
MCDIFVGKHSLRRRHDLGLGRTEAQKRKSRRRRHRRTHSREPQGHGCFPGQNHSHRRGRTEPIQGRDRARRNAETSQEGRTSSQPTNLGFGRADADRTVRKGQDRRHHTTPDRLQWWVCHHLPRRRRPSLTRWAGCRGGQTHACWSPFELYFLIN